MLIVFSVVHNMAVKKDDNELVEIPDTNRYLNPAMFLAVIIVFFLLMWIGYFLFAASIGSVVEYFIN